MKEHESISGLSPARRPLNRLVPPWVLIAALIGLSGCRYLVGTAAVTVAAVGLVGYGVYKTGESAVTGVGSALSGVASGARSFLFADGDFTATCEGTVDEVWRAGDTVLRANGFGPVRGTRDALSGHLLSSTSSHEEITVKMEAAAGGQTHVRVRIGADGNLEKSETLYSLIAAQVAAQRGTGRRESP